MLDIESYRGERDIFISHVAAAPYNARLAEDRKERERKEKERCPR